MNTETIAPRTPKPAFQMLQFRDWTRGQRERFMDSYRLTIRCYGAGSDTTQAIALEIVACTWLIERHRDMQTGMAQFQGWVHDGDRLKTVPHLYGSGSTYSLLSAEIDRLFNQIFRLERRLIRERNSRRR